MGWGTWTVFGIVVLGLLIFQETRDDAPAAGPQAVGPVIGTSFEDAHVSVEAQSAKVWDASTDCPSRNAQAQRCIAISVSVKSYAYRDLNVSFGVQLDGKPVQLLHFYKTVHHGWDSTYDDAFWGHHTHEARAYYQYWLVLLVDYEPDGYGLVVTGTYDEPQTSYKLTASAVCGQIWDRRTCAGLPP